MASCNPVPTQTVFRTDVKSSPTVIGTTTSFSVSTSPPSVSTVYQSACTLSASDGSCAAYSTSSVVNSIPGTEQTFEVVIPITSNVLVSETVPVQTLYSTCNDVVTSTTSTPISTSTPTTSRSTSTISEVTIITNGGTTLTTTVTSRTTTPDQVTTTSTPTTPTSRGSISYGTPSIYTSSIFVTLSNGQVSTSAAVVTSTPTTWVNETPSSSGPGVGLIVGSVVGGFVGLSLIAALVWVLWRRRGTRWDDIFDDKEDDLPGPQPRMNLIDVEPKPYQYGIVGAQSPPQSPGAGRAPLHDRRASEQPLLGGTRSTTQSFHSLSPSTDFSPHSLNNHPMSPAAVYNTPGYYPENHMLGRPQSVSATSSHSRDPSMHSALGASSSRARTPYSDEQGFVTGYPPAPVPPSSYPVDRKQRPLSMPQHIQPQPLMPPSPPGPRPTSANAGGSTNFTPMQLIPPATQAVGKTGHRLQGSIGAPQAPAPPPYEASSPSPTEASTVITPLSMQHARLGLANPDTLSPRSP